MSEAATKKSEQEKYILSKGWTVNPESDEQYFNPFIPKEKQFGGMLLHEAVEQQNEYDLIDKNGRFYLMRRNRYGFGYEVLYYTEKKFPPKYELQEDSLSKEDAEKIVRACNENSDKGIGYNKLIIQKIVVLNERGAVYYYIVTGIDDLYKVAKATFTRRDREGWWFQGYEEAEPPVKPIIPKEQAAAYNKELRDAVLKVWENYEAQIKYRKLLDQLYKLYKQAQQDASGKYALEFLMKRDSENLEGEYFTIIEPDKI